MSIILKIIGVILLGALGALLFNLFALPLLLTSPYFENFQFVKDFKEGKVVINQTERVYIQENTALENAIEKGKNSVVAVAGYNGMMSGFIASSDGNIITLAGGIPASGSVSVVLNEEQVSANVVRVNRVANLALLKIDRNNLQTVGFADAQNIKLGQKVFLVAPIVANITSLQSLRQPEGDNWFVNEGILRQIGPESLQTTMTEKSIANGSPLFNVSAQLVGINMVLPDGKVSAIPVNKVQELLGL